MLDRNLQNELQKGRHPEVDNETRQRRGEKNELESFEKLEETASNLNAAAFNDTSKGDSDKENLTKSNSSQEIELQELKSISHLHQEAQQQHQNQELHQHQISQNGSCRDFERRFGDTLSTSMQQHHISITGALDDGASRLELLSERPSSPIRNNNPQAHYQSHHHRQLYHQQHQPHHPNDINSIAYPSTPTNHHQSPVTAAGSHLPGNIHPTAAAQFMAALAIQQQQQVHSANLDNVTPRHFLTFPNRPTHLIEQQQQSQQVATPTVELELAGTTGEQHPSHPLLSSSTTLPSLSHSFGMDTTTTATTFRSGSHSPNGSSIGGSEHNSIGSGRGSTGLNSPYVCNRCTAFFSTREQLEKHELILHAAISPNSSNQINSASSSGVGVGSGSSGLTMAAGAPQSPLSQNGLNQVSKTH